MRIVIATVVHHPEDARIFHRQIPALIEAGHEVVYVAPETERDLGRPGLVHVPVPRSVGRRRLGPLKRMASALSRETRVADLAIVHDPELTLMGRWIRCPRVWDVHEDLASQIADKEWIPGFLGGPARLGVGLLERWAARSFDVMLAEPTYVDRFPHGVVVRNTPWIQDRYVTPGDSRVVYVGRVSLGRGIGTMLAAMRMIGPTVGLDLYGSADRDVVAMLDRAGSNVVVHGFVPNPNALSQAEGAMAGLALLDDRPDYRRSIPTKVLEYMSRGIPVVTTPNPVARRIVEESAAGIVVPYRDPEAVAEAVVRLRDPVVREEMGRNGRQAIRACYDWAEDAGRMLGFVDEVVSKVAAGGRCRGPGRKQASR